MFDVRGYPRSFLEQQLAPPPPRPYSHTWKHIMDVTEHGEAEDAAITAARSADVLPSATTPPPRPLNCRPVQPPSPFCHQLTRLDTWPCFIATPGPLSVHSSHALDRSRPPPATLSPLPSLTRPP